MQRLNLLQNVTRYYSWFATDVVTNKYDDDSNMSHKDGTFRPK